MAKRYFAPKRQSKLPKILFYIILTGFVAAGIYKGYGWLKSRHAVPAFIATQPTTATVTLEDVEAQVKAGDTAGARERLKEITAGNDASVTPQALLLQAQLEKDAGNKGEAMALLARLNKDYQNSQEHALGSARYARLLEEEGKQDEALVIYTSLRETAPPEFKAAALAGFGRKAEREKDLLAARDLFVKATADAKWNSDIWADALESLGRVNTALIFSPVETPESRKYVVQKGDSITSIGNKLNTTQGLLLRANNLQEGVRLHVGQLMKYTAKDFRIVVERSTCRLFLMDKDGLFKMYRVGLGMPGFETSLGKYTLGNKQKDPTWFKPGQAAIPAGDPQNELGTRWMPLVPAATGLPSDLGIHGTIAPETIGQYKSHGCPRLKKEDVEELYDLVVRSTPVEIVDVFEPAKTEMIAKS